MSDFDDHVNEKRNEDRRKSKGFDFKGPERRASKRIKGIIVEYKKHGSRDAPKSAFLRDMSSKGLSITLTENFNVCAILDINVFLTGVGHPAVVEAKVCWVKISDYLQKSDKVHFDLGLEICKAADGDLTLIDEYIAQHETDVYE